MKMAVMQPYLFPYIGYFQLLNAVDLFVIFDDVTFIKKGWINRNRILLNGKSHMFTLPLSNISQNTLIRDIKVSTTDFWYKKITKTLEHAYRKAPYYTIVSEMIKEVFSTTSAFLIDWQLNSFNHIMEYLSIDTEIISSSQISNQTLLKGESRIINICHRYNCNDYFNLSGGWNIYDVDRFSRHDIVLKFIHSKEVEYRQFENSFVSWLSIIDVLMFCSVDQIFLLLKEYEFVDPSKCNKLYLNT